MSADTIQDPTKDPAALDRARKALLDCLAAIDRAEAMNLAARDALRAADLPCVPGLPPLHLTDARRAAQFRLDRLPAPEQYVRPTHRRLRGTNGATGRFPVKIAREMARDGLVAEWLDGMPPEQPAPEEHPQGKRLFAW